MGSAGAPGTASTPGKAAAQSSPSGPAPAPAPTAARRSFRRPARASARTSRAAGRDGHRPEQRVAHHDPPAQLVEHGVERRVEPRLEGVDREHGPAEGERDRVEVDAMESGPPLPAGPAPSSTSRANAARSSAPGPARGVEAPCRDPAGSGPERRQGVPGECGGEVGRRGKGSAAAALGPVAARGP